MNPTLLGKNPLTAPYTVERNGKWLLVIALFILLTLIYFRNVISVPPDAMLTRHQGTDLFLYFLHTFDYLQWLTHGFIPIGDYWVPHGGGFPATPLDQLLNPSSLLLLGIYSITHNFLVSLRIIEPTFYFLALITSYWYGLTLLKKQGPAVVLSVAYVFSMYGVVQTEHLDLQSALVLIPLALTFLEKTFTEGKAKYIVLTSLSIFLVYLTHLYPIFYLLMFIVLRLAYELIRNPQRLKTLTSITEVGGLFTLMAIPFFLPQLAAIPAQWLKDDALLGIYNYAQPPGRYFIRATGSLVSNSMYMGLSVLLLALLPTVLPILKKKDYIFYLTATMLVAIYAVGRFGPVNLAVLVHNLIPLAFYARVPHRALVIGYLTLATCAAIGFSNTIERIKKCRVLLTGVVILIIFSDLTIGFEPSTMPMPLPNNNAYEFIAEQPGDFRVIEIPSIRTQVATTSMYTNHDTISWLRWAYNFYEPLYALTELFPGLVNREVSATQLAFYGVKYLIINTAPDYYKGMQPELGAVAGESELTKLSQTQYMKDWINSTEDYKLVYDNNNYAVYENLQYQGLVFEETPREALITYSLPNPNTVIIDISSPQPTDIIISQCFDEGWVTNIGTLTRYDSMQRLSVPAGINHVVLHYNNYEKSLRWFLLYIPLAFLIAWMMRRDHIRRRRNTLHGHN